VNIENNTKFKNTLKKKTRGWAESDPRPRRSRAGGPLSSLGQNCRGDLLGVAQPTAIVARPAQVGAACLARTWGGHRTQSRRGGATPAGESVAEVR
jgi:hypothetical protein